MVPPPPPPPLPQKPPKPAVEDLPKEPMETVPTMQANCTQTFDTLPNQFGLFRRYNALPKHDPEDGLPLHKFADVPSHIWPRHSPEECDPLRPLGTTAAKVLVHGKEFVAQSFAPFLNCSTFKLMEWQ